MTIPTRHINFSHNWNNKLDNEWFTTIRSWTEKKEKYYRNSIWQPFNVLLNNKKKKEAKLIDMNVLQLVDIPPEIIILDTGMTYTDGMRLFDKFGLKLDSKAIFLLFRSEYNAKRTN